MWKLRVGALSNQTAQPSVVPRWPRAKSGARRGTPAGRCRQAAGATTTRRRCGRAPPSGRGTAGAVTGDTVPHLMRGVARVAQDRGRGPQRPTVVGQVDIAGRVSAAERPATACSFRQRAIWAVLSSARRSAKMQVTCGAVTGSDASWRSRTPRRASAWLG